MKTSELGKAYQKKITTISKSLLYRLTSLMTTHETIQPVAKIVVESKTEEEIIKRLDEFEKNQKMIK